MARRLPRCLVTDTRPFTGCGGSMPSLSARGFAILALLLAASLANGVVVATQHFDNARSGANTQETVLTPANVKVATFGKQFSMTMDANVNGQALYVPGLTINGGTHNALFCYTSNNADGSPCSAYAFDADTGAQ